MRSHPRHDSRRRIRGGGVRRRLGRRTARRQGPRDGTRRRGRRRLRRIERPERGRHQQPLQLHLHVDGVRDPLRGARRGRLERRLVRADPRRGPCWLHRQPGPGCAGAHARDVVAAHPERGLRRSRGSHIGQRARRFELADVGRADLRRRRREAPLADPDCERRPGRAHDRRWHLLPALPEQRVEHVCRGARRHLAAPCRGAPAFPGLGRRGPVTVAASGSARRSARSHRSTSSSRTITSSHRRAGVRAAVPAPSAVRQSTTCRCPAMLSGDSIPAIPSH